jgi:hypothetical protein
MAAAMMGVPSEWGAMLAPAVGMMSEKVLEEVWVSPRQSAWVSARVPEVSEVSEVSEALKVAVVAEVMAPQQAWASGWRPWASARPRGQPSQSARS